MFDEYHQGIRTLDDIKTFAEAIQDDESFCYGDYYRDEAEADLGYAQLWCSNAVGDVPGR